MQVSAPSAGSALGSLARVTRRCGSSVVNPIILVIDAGTAVSQMLIVEFPFFLENIKYICIYICVCIYIYTCITIRKENGRRDKQEMAANNNVCAGSVKE